MKPEHDLLLVEALREVNRESGKINAISRDGDYDGLLRVICKIEIALFAAKKRLLKLT